MFLCQHQQAQDSAIRSASLTLHLPKYQVVNMLNLMLSPDPDKKMDFICPCQKIFKLDLDSVSGNKLRVACKMQIFWSGCIHGQQMPSFFHKVPAMNKKWRLLPPEELFGKFPFVPKSNLVHCVSYKHHPLLQLVGGEVVNVTSPVGGDRQVLSVKGRLSNQHHKKARLKSKQKKKAFPFPNIWHNKFEPALLSIPDYSLQGIESMCDPTKVILVTEGYPHAKDLPEACHTRLKQMRPKPEIMNCALQHL